MRYVPNWWPAVRTDVRYALRGLRRAPLFTAVTVLSLALGIGAATTMVSVTDAVDVRPLAFPHAERLVWLHETAPAGNPACDGFLGCSTGASTAAIADWRAQGRALDAIGALGYRPRRLVRGDAAEPLRGADVSAALFSVLGTPPLFGRTLTAADEAPGSEPVVVLGHELWRTRFGGDPIVLGTRVTLLDDFTEREERFTVVGVMPPTFRLLSTEAWTPMRERGLYAPTQRDARQVLAIGRLASGRTIPEADAEVRTIAGRAATAYPESSAGWSAGAVPFDAALQLRFNQLGGTGTRVGLSRSLLLAVVALVLLVAAMNVAILFLVRATMREHALAVRQALGATRGRLVRLLLAEAMVVAFAAGALGLAIAAWGVRVVGRGLLLDTAGIPVRLDARVLGVALAVTLVTALGAGLLPSWRGARRAIGGALRTVRLDATGRRHRMLGRDALVVCEIAAGLFLLSCAGLLAKELRRLQDEPGFETRGLYAMELALPPRDQRDVLRQRLLADEALARADRTPGAQATAVMTADVVPATPDGLDAPPRDEARPRKLRISAGFFRTLGAPVLRGREFTAADRAGSPPVVVVDARAASTYWPGVDPIGRRIMYRDSVVGDVTATVVGVVGVVKYGSRLTSTLFDPARPHLYRPIAQAPAPPWRVTLELFVRSELPAGQVVPALRRMVHDLAGRPVDRFEARAEEARVREELRQQRFNAAAVGTFALFGLFLAALGLYGVVAYTVTTRTREIGVHVALGAARARVLWLVGRRGAALALAGLTVGAAGSWAGTRILGAMLAGTEATDATVFAGSAATLAVVALIASLVPAHRATRVDPATVLRSE